MKQTRKFDSNDRYVIRRCGANDYQFSTGMRDSNGELMMEGDIVQTVSGARGKITWIPEICGFRVVGKDVVGKEFECAVCETQTIIRLMIWEKQYVDETL